MKGSVCNKVELAKDELRTLKKKEQKNKRF